VVGLAVRVGLLVVGPGILAAIVPARSDAVPIADVVREIHAAGHALALHGDSHAWLHAFHTPRSVRDQITRAAASVETVTGARPRFFRPPFGHTSLTTVLGAHLAGVTLVAWSSRGYDGLRRRKPEAVVKRVARTLVGGAIVMLHDASEHDDFEPASVRALPRLLALLDERGLTSVGLEALLSDAPHAP
jgi:peptidoglycan/xylan/chitin deacetylase (PgdA/CDA1 family)